MRLKNLRKSIENLPRPAYIFLKAMLAMAAALLLASALLYAIGGGGHETRHFAALLLEVPAGVLLLGLIGLALLVDRFQ